MLEHYAYGGALLVSLAGLLVADYRWRLAFFADWRRAAVSVVGGVLIFVVWDLAGIGAGIFFIGNGPYLSGWQLASQFPVEEIGFLSLLMYSALLAWRAGEKLWRRT
jgi:lycopene cyclase domain-containing protein